MKTLLVLIFIVPIALHAQTGKNKIIMVVSSYGKDMGKARPGFEMDEFSQAYLIFKSNGFYIDVASPRGGAVEAGQFNKEKPYNKIVLQDSVVINILQSTKATASLHAKDYDAIYIVGGKGPMFDLVVDPSLQDLILEMNRNKATIAAICHGTIAFANIKKDAKYLVEGRSITGYCNEEEAMFGKTASELPFLLEDKLLQRGAKYQKGEPMLPFVIRDDNFITGQNPYSTTQVAEEIIKALGKVPVKRIKYKDEMSMELVKNALQGEMAFATTELEINKANYDLELIAVYGYYQAMFAKDDLGKMKKATSIIELVTPYYFNEDLYVKLAEYFIKLGDTAKATRAVNDVLKRNPNSQGANAILAQLKE